MSDCNNLGGHCGPGFCDCDGYKAFATRYLGDLGEIMKRTRFNYSTAKRMADWHSRNQKRGDQAIESPEP